MKHVRGILAYSEFCQKRQLAFDFPIYTIHSYLHFLAFLTNCVPVALQIPLKDAVIYTLPCRGTESYLDHFTLTTFILLLGICLHP